MQISWNEKISIEVPDVKIEKKVRENIEKKVENIPEISLENTIEIEEKDQRPAWRKLSILFFGDLMYDRWVSRMLSTGDLLWDHFSHVREELNTGVLLWKNLYDIDFVWLNLETPLVDNLDDCKVINKTIPFCSSSLILWYIKSLGVNLVNIANNHVRDNGKRWVNISRQILEREQMPYFGSLRGYGSRENYIVTWNVRGVKTVWLGYDFTIAQDHLSYYCKQVKIYVTQDYLPLLSIHRGAEYRSKHGKMQDYIAHKLIDCWAEVILGHHPHVIQDIEWYKGKPIVYSLGNFLFDQKKRDTTQIGMWAYVEISSGEINLGTGNFGAYPYVK